MAPEPEDELLSTAGMPRWIQWGAGAAVVVAVVAVVVVQTRSARGPIPSASTAGAGAGTGSPSPALITFGTPAMTPVPLPPAAQPVDVVTSAAGTWVLTGDRLIQLGTPAVRMASLSAGPADGTEADLMLDPTAHRLWVVALGARHSIVQVFDSQTLRPLGALSWSREIVAAAPLRGALYLADTGGLSHVLSNGSATPVSLPDGQQVLDVVADPSRDRALMLVRAESGLLVTALGRDGRMFADPAPPDLVKGWLAVTGSGSVWLAGFGRSGAVLDRLDPATFQRRRVSPLDVVVGPGAVLLASGTNSLLITSGDGHPGVWCMADDVGTPEQYWSVPADAGAVTSGRAYVVVGTHVVRLELADRCSG